MTNKFVAAAVGALAVIGVATSASAGAVNFNISSGYFTTGSGYGNSNGQLDVTFTNLFTQPQSFSLDLNQTQSFLFGRATLNETCINNGFFACGASDFLNSELDNLDVTANFTFTSPVSQLVQSVAVTGAFSGPVNGDTLFGKPVTDYYIDFSPVTISFGTGGEFVLDVGDMYFNSTGSITNGANVTLTAVPVPEPASLAVLGAGLLGLGFLRRRKEDSEAVT
ncbi:PEP-CTERM sorting domain-containing protein [Azospirillum canadense]|uniref:PEP-CTERM sorting domain-containing protein n=1 Tax=Azospirillum canadense TaxID=403962 RepID=UPI002225DECB|nr:PEP-CTERM sorting domain-containing protein [Azospirillum canadense]MCW2240931.1 hypothetical protein [Azospirillum canadense]